MQWYLTNFNNRGEPFDANTENNNHDAWWEIVNSGLTKWGPVLKPLTNCGLVTP